MHLFRTLTLLVSLACAAQAQSLNSQNWRARSAADPALTGQERFDVFLHNNFLSAGAYLRAVGPSLGSQLGNNPPEWGKTAEGFGRRVGTQFAIQSSRGAISAASAAAFGRDPRYQRCDCKGAWRRTGHAISGLVLGADSSGTRRFDPSNLLGAYGSGYIGANFYPDRFNVAVKGYQLGNQQVSQAVLQNILVEFGPDLSRFFKKKILRR
jgi:hypothetical protein